MIGKHEVVCRKNINIKLKYINEIKGNLGQPAYLNAYRFGF